mmetsp:Transcript_5866/g.12748  ORF Transcript_5866/g.12748 Transcript_5866/m.12748 type:complete len:266 (-) Transcript_5866:61-858(-)
MLCCLQVPVQVVVFFHRAGPIVAPAIPVVGTVPVLCSSSSSTRFVFVVFFQSLFQIHHALNQGHVLGFSHPEPFVPASYFVPQRREFRSEPVDMVQEFPARCRVVLVDHPRQRLVLQQAIPPLQGLACEVSGAADLLRRPQDLSGSLRFRRSVALGLSLQVALPNDQPGRFQIQQVHLADQLVLGLLDELRGVVRAVVVVCDGGGGRQRHPEASVFLCAAGQGTPLATGLAEVVCVEPVLQRIRCDQRDTTSGGVFVIGARYHGR